MQVEVDKRYKVTSGRAQAYSVVNIEAQLCWLRQALKHETKGLGLKSHARLTLYLKHLLNMIIYDIYIHIKIDIKYIHIQYMINIYIQQWYSPF